jgi:pimeloyl-ACP methyl ester carboxylesterase
MKRLGHWIIDYLYLIHGQTVGLLRHKAPKHYLGFVRENKSPVILIPGLLERWGFLKKLGDKISMEGYPVYIVPNLGYNLKDIPACAKIVRELIEKTNIQNAVIVAHSKGGLIGKYLLIHLNDDQRVKRVISIATPYSGSSLIKFLPHKSFRELRTDSKIILDLESHKEVNKKIISIAPVFDNHIWEGSRLEGAKNIAVDEKGHHKIIYNKELEKIILSSLSQL